MRVNMLARNFERLFTPFDNFIHKQSTAGALLIGTALISMLVANSSWGYLLEVLSNLPVGIIFNEYHFALSIHEWLSSGFMALFFFMIGLELKRELLAGSLQDRQLVIPILSASLGGIGAPAVLYWILNQSDSVSHGWAIPTATDTAFALVALRLINVQISIGVKVFLAALAIFDDIGAIIVVAVFYSDQVNLSYLIFAFSLLGILFLLNVLGVRRGSIFILLGIPLWWAVYRSGVHATMSGLLMAMVVPATTELAQNAFTVKLKGAISVFEKQFDFGVRILQAPSQHTLAMDIERTVLSAITPLQRWHSLLIGPVSLFVLPSFALLNAGISISSDTLFNAFNSSVTLGVILGLALGKPIGVVLCTLLALKTGMGRLPDGVSMREVVLVGFLSGIGFTMSLFITRLSFASTTVVIDHAKLGIIIGSILSLLLAFVWSRVFRVS